MKTSLTILLVIFINISLLGCTIRAPGIEGYITDIKDGKILVVDSINKDFSSTGGLEEFYNAIWFSNAPKGVKVGQKVQVWFDLVLTSYPGQSDAKKVVILSRKKPDKANLAEDETIRRALKLHHSEFKGVTVIKKVNYDMLSDTWNVIIKQDKDEFNVQVEDK
jgi:hypothetical protein